MGPTYENVYERIVKIVIAELEIDESMVKKEANFRDDLGADSIAMLEIIMSIEEEFDIDIPDDQSKKISTVDQAVKYIIKKRVDYINLSA